MKLSLLYEGFSSPITLVQNQNEPGKIYVGEQIGRIWKIDTSTGKRKIFLDIQEALVELQSSYEERGLLDFKFHPDYPSDNRLFIFYSTPFNKTYANYLSEITIWNSTDQEEDFEIQEEPLLIIEKDFNFHNGGRMEFGPDGYLYLALGDGGDQEDPENHGQRPDVILGKVLRLDVSTPGTYGIPKGNPFVNMNDYNPLIYALGFRNPWGISFDSSGNLFLADVGYNDVEEIDIVVKGGNYGWNIKEGSETTSFGQENITGIKLTDPIFEYTHDWIKSLDSYGPEGKSKKKAIAVIGGYPLTDGSYIFGDLSGLLLRIQPKVDESQEWKIIDSLTIDRFIKGFGKDTSGNIYLLCSDKMGPYDNGEIYLVE